MLRSVVSCRRLPAARAGAALVAAFAAGAPAAHAAQFPVDLTASQLPRTTLSAPGVRSLSSTFTDVAANDAGDAVAAWTVTRGSNIGPASETVVQVAFRSGGGGWSAPQTVSDAAYTAGAPSVGIDARGVATVAWGESKMGETSYVNRVRVTTHSAAGLASTQDITESEELQWAPSVAVAASGQAVLAYTASRPVSSAATKARSVVKVAQRTTPAGTFGASQTVSSDVVDAEASSGGGRGWATAAINATGTAAVVWEETQGPEGPDKTGRIRVSRGPVGSPLGTSVDLTAPSVPGLPYNPHAVVAPDGAITASWAQDLGGSPYLGPVDLAVRRIAPDGGLGSLQTLASNASGDDGYHNQVAVELGVDAAGRLTAAWPFPAPVFPDYSPTNIQTASSNASGDFGPAQTVADVHGTFKTSLAVDASGAAAISWGGQGKFLIIARRLAGASNFGPAAKSSDPWVDSISSAFGRPNELTLVFGTALPSGGGDIVESVTTVLGSFEAISSLAPDTVKPVVSVNQVSVVAAPRKKGKKQPGRLVATLAASEPVSVRAVVSQARKGIKRGGKCVKRPSSVKLRKGKKKCTRTVVIGPEVGAPVSPDGSTLDLGAAPPNGSYKLTVKARDAAGNAGETVTFPFSLG